MIIYLAIVNVDKERNEVKNFIKFCEESKIQIEISDSILPGDEIDKLKKSNIAIIIFSNSSICSTWLVGLLEEMKNNFIGKYYYFEFDKLDLPKAFKNFSNKAERIEILDKKFIDKILTK